MAARVRLSVTGFTKAFICDSRLTQKSHVLRAVICPNFTNHEVPIAMFGGSVNYASALYIAAAKTNVLDKVESELLDLFSATTKASTVSQVMKDLAVPADIRVKVINEICAQAKFSDVTKNFLHLTMAHRGEVKAVVASVIPLPAEEEKELKETLQEKLGKGKSVKLEQKIDPSILGGLVVEFGQKVFDMSIKTRARQMERFLCDPVNFDA